jgi:hypothetical protein
MQNPLFMKTVSLKSTARRFLKQGSYGKSKYKNIFGCSIEFYKSYIESQFKDGMSWNNHGEWHIDHIKPLGLAKTERELKKLFHYKNVQPLWADENRKKGVKNI